MTPSRLNQLLAATSSIVYLAAAPVTAQVPDKKPTDVVIQGHVYKPQEMKPTDDFMERLKLPDGFKIAKFDDNLSNTRMLAIGDEAGKRLYVTRREQDDCLLLKDEDGDGRADGEPVTVASREGMHGIVFHENKVYLVTVTDVFVADVKADGTFGELEKIISDLPDGGQHQNRTLAVGPKDGKLYITVGSTCNACDESSKESATVLTAELDGTTRTLFASGLRNTIGIDWHPETGQMWGMEHGIDWLGNDAPKEELNKLDKDKFYGWPLISGDGMRSPQDEPPPGTTFEEWETSTTLPALSYTAHAAPMQMKFYPTGAFPEEYHGDAFVTMRGSWNREPPSGYEVVRVHFNDQGNPEKMEPFLTGFLQKQGEEDWEQYGRLSGLAIAPDGSAMFIADDQNGVIYRITYSE